MFVLTLEYLVSKDRLDPTRAAHLEWLRNGVDSGAILVAGARPDAAGGVVITSDMTADQAGELIEADPWHRESLVRYQRTEFRPVLAAPGVFPGAATEEVTLINVAITGDPDASLDTLGSAVEHVAATADGFLGSRLLRSTDDDSIVNFARWASRAKFDAIFDDPEFKQRYELFAQTTESARYRLYTTAHIYSPARH